jgi:hypothetical protein
MKKLNDAQLAEFLLKTRQKEGHASWWHLKRNALRWSLFFCCTVCLLGLGIFAKSWGFCCFVLGLSIGTVSRDGQQLRQHRAVWPFYDKVIDWIKVEKIAKGEQLS